MTRHAHGYGVNMAEVWDEYVCAEYEHDGDEWSEIEALLDDRVHQVYLFMYDVYELWLN